jgi:hypothetical protein
LFTIIGGTIADRHDRRRLLLGSQYVQMATAFALAALVFFGLVQATSATRSRKPAFPTPSPRYWRIIEASIRSARPP